MPATRSNRRPRSCASSGSLARSRPASSPSTSWATRTATRSRPAARSPATSSKAAPTSLGASPPFGKRASTSSTKTRRRRASTSPRTRSLPRTSSIPSRWCVTTWRASSPTNTRPSSRNSSISPPRSARCRRKSISPNICRRISCGWNLRGALVAKTPHPFEFAGTPLCPLPQGGESRTGDDAASPREIRLTHVRIVDQLAPASLDRNRTRFQEIGVIAHVERGRGILLHHENGRAGRTNVGDNVERALDDRGSKPERRLVEHDELGLRHQGSADRKHLLLAAGQGSRRLPAALGKPRKLIEDARHIGRDPSPIRAEIAAHFQIFQHRHLREYVASLRTMREPECKNGARGGVGDVVSIEHDRAGSRMQQSRDRLQRRGLAGSVRPDQGDELAFADGERHALERRHLAVATDDIAQLKHASFLLPSRRE